jgi:hypothetical protein
LEGFWVSAWDGSGLFGGGDNALKLRLTDEGLEGIALGDSQDLSSGPGLTISLRPEGAKQPGGEGKPKPKIEGKVRKGTDNPFGQQKSEKSGPQELKPE